MVCAKVSGLSSVESAKVTRRSSVGRVKERGRCAATKECAVELVVTHDML